MRALVRSFAALAFLASTIGAARADPPIWVIRDADSTMVLFGSVHVLPPGDDWRIAALTEALAQADEVWFEIPFDAQAQAEITRQVGARALLPRGQTLSPRLPTAAAERLARVAGRLGLYRAGLERMQPWMAEVTIGLASDIRVGGLPENGVDRRIDAELAPNVPRMAFESVADQIASLSGASQASQIASLAETLRDLEEDPGGYERIVSRWRAGDLIGLQAEALEPMRRTAPEIYQRLIVQRNERWTQIIRRRMAGSGRSVVIVGVGHLIGPQSVPALLRAHGMTVDGP